jgi:diguanylate cyclase (GGDEF)-like protein
MRKPAKRTPQIWLLGLAGQPAKRIRQAIPEAFEVKRFDMRDIPSQSDFERADPTAVFIDVATWRTLRAGMPAWVRTARKVLVAPENEALDHAEVLAQGFLSCLSPPIGKAKISAALEAARETAGFYEDISKILSEAQRERDQMVQENGRLAFFQHILARAMSSLSLASILSGMREDLGLAFPVSEVLGVFWGPTPESEIFLPEGLSAQAKATRTDYLLDLVSRLRGAPSRSYRTHNVPGGDESAPAEPGRALLVPLHHQDVPFGCLSVLIHRDLAKHEQETARQALLQLAPCVKNSLDYLLLKRKADRDGLTGLFNRRSFDARLDQELKRHMRHKEGFVLLMADLDHFKKVNDTFGHLAGDAALRHAAHSLEAGLRSTDFLARYGGEEFGIILPHTGQSQGWMLAERLRRRVAGADLRYGGQAIPVTVSIGLATFVPGQAATPASLLSQADQALYAAKNAGRNRVSIAITREDQRDAAQGGEMLAG